MLHSATMHVNMIAIFAIDMTEGNLANVKQCIP